MQTVNNPTPTEGQNAPRVAPPLATVRAERRAKATPAAETPAPTEAAKVEPAKAGEAPSALAKPAEAPKTATAQIDVPNAELDKFVGLVNDNRELSKKVQTLEKTAAGAAKLAEAEKLASEGKTWDAIRLINPKWFDEAAKEVLGTKDHPATVKVDPVIEELRAKVAELEGKLTKQDERLSTEDQAKLAGQRAEGVKAIKAEIKKPDVATKFPYLSKNEGWVDEALAEADANYKDAVKANDGKELSDDQKNKLLRVALEHHEERRAADAKFYAPSEEKRGATFTSEMRGSLPKGGGYRHGGTTVDDLKRARRSR